MVERMKRQPTRKRSHTPGRVAEKLGVLLVFGAHAACSSSPPQFPLRAPLTKDADTKPVFVRCRDAKDKKEPGKLACMPEEYESSFAWDGADNMLFRPIAKFLEVDPHGEARNVNALDEVPDSSWFQNRWAGRNQTPEQVAVGPCANDLDPNADTEPGSWTIDQGKANGATPGFRIRTKDKKKFLLKNQPGDEAERASAASAIGVRLYHAAGFNTSCDSVVYFDPKLLKLNPGLRITDNTGVSRPFDQKALDTILNGSPHRGEQVRMQSSAWLEGIPLGPFRYEGVRADDPNDVVAHEERRELRGARLLAAWINHFDAREQNSMMTWHAADKKKPESSPGHVRHYYLDVSDSMGSQWPQDGISKRLGKSYYFDGKDIAVDFITLGLLDRPWQHSEKDPRTPGYGYFRADDFVPEDWKPGYQNPAFLRMSEHDGAWMARIIAHIRPADVAAIVKTGQIAVPSEERVITEVLQERRMRILRRYLTRLSPLADVTTSARGVCATDLALQNAVAPVERFAYRADVAAGAARTRGKVVVSQAYTDGSVCVDIPRTEADGGTPHNDASRYRVVRIWNGLVDAPLEIHLYDRGPTKGLVLVGLVRP